MKIKQKLTLLTTSTALFLAGCKAILIEAGYFSAPPSDIYLWTMQNSTSERVEYGVQGCYEYKRKVTPPNSYEHQKYFEQCMLDQGYKFTNVRMEGNQNYCAVYKGGPACRSVGQ